MIAARRSLFTTTRVARRAVSSALFVTATCVAISFTNSARAQFFERGGPLPPAEVERIDSTATTHLENAQRFLAERQWDEAVEAIRRVMEQNGAELVRVEGGESPSEFATWIPVHEYCQRRLAQLAADAPEALARYRALVDPLAEQWYRQAIEQHREDLLQRILDQAFASQWGDDALLAAGEFRLQKGDYAQARAHWQRISPQLTDSPDAPPSPLGNRYPDTKLDLADVRARLVLVSVLEGSLERAEAELVLLHRLHPGAQGRIAGRTGTYLELLQQWIDAAREWPPRRISNDWPTFAGNLQRNGRAPADVDIAGRPIWSFPLPRLDADLDLIAASRMRVAEDGKGLLSYHPIVVGRTVFLRTDVQEKSFITALDLDTGTERWQVDYPRSVAQRGFRDEATETPNVSDAHAGLPRHLGVARYTLTSTEGKLFALMGSQVSGPAARRVDRLLSKDQGWLLGLDLRSEGKPLEGFPIRPESSSWSFEGTPIYDAGMLYVMMRRVDGPRSQIHVACFELPTGPTAIDDSDDDSRPSGRLRWRTKIVSSTTVGGGDVDELSHGLLSLSHGRLFCNTNQGAVARLRASDGRIDWLTTYPRAAFRGNDPDRAERHFFRDLNPCLLAKDWAIAAPADHVTIFALDQGTGSLIWRTPEGDADDPVHLLGTADNTLLASGDWLYWIDLRTGRLLTQYPAPTGTAPGLAAPSPRGFGRGVLVGSHVYWPTRENIYVFDQQPAKTPRGWTPKGVREIQLVPRGVTGGNLVMAEGVLLIASGDRLYAFDERGPRGNPPDVTEAH